MLLSTFRTAFAANLTVKFWTAFLRNFFAAFPAYFLIKFSAMSLSGFFSAFSSCFSNSHLPFLFSSRILKNIHLR